jgi:hypothetical protein
LSKKLYTSNSKKNQKLDKINLEKLDIESYQLLKGRFSEIIISQTGSRCMQKALKGANLNIINLLYEEVKYL